MALDGADTILDLLETGRHDCRAVFSSPAGAKDLCVVLASAGRLVGLFNSLFHEVGRELGKEGGQTKGPRF